MTENQRTSKQPHRFPVERRHILKDEERRRWLPPEPILDAARISPGATVIEVGAGTGFWTLPLSKLVGPSGKVIATDIEPIMVRELHILIEDQEAENIVVVQSEELHIPLPDQVADAAVLAFVLHEPSDPSAFLHEVTRLLRSAGSILVVDWQKRATEHGPPVEHRLSEEETRDMLQVEGYVVETLTSPTSDVYVLLACRP